MLLAGLEIGRDGHAWRGFAAHRPPGSSIRGTPPLLRVLEVVLFVKRIMARIRDSEGLWARLTNIVTLLLVLPGSKFLVLELTDLAFGGAVQLGGFFQVTGSIIALMLARWGVRRLLAKATSDETS